MATVPVSGGNGDRVVVGDVVKIEALIELVCCDMERDAAFERSIGRGTLGATLGKIVCDGCGSEYTIGVIVTRPDVFEEPTNERVDEILDEIGVDRGDYEPSDEEPALCVGCDGGVDRRMDFCAGCKEYVCETCRKREPGNARRHMSEEHWIAPTPVAPVKGTKAESAGDGSSFVAEEEL